MTANALGTFVLSYSGHKICQTNPMNKEKDDLPGSSVTASALRMFVSRAT